MKELTVEISRVDITEFTLTTEKRRATIKFINEKFDSVDFLVAHSKYDYLDWMFLKDVALFIEGQQGEYSRLEKFHR